MKNILLTLSIAGLCIILISSSNRTLSEVDTAKVAPFVQTEKLLATSTVSITNREKVPLHIQHIWLKAFYANNPEGHWGGAHYLTFNLNVTPVDVNREIKGFLCNELALPANEGAQAIFNEFTSIIVLPGSNLRFDFHAPTDGRRGFTLEYQITGEYY